MKLLEQYAKKLSVCESIYSATHGGAKMDDSRKVVVAKCLENTTKFLTEALDGTLGTQRADMGLYKKFCVNLTTVTMPTLIAPELIMVQPMTASGGYVTYLKFTAGRTKGEYIGEDAGNANYHVFNSAFGLGPVYNPSYTSSRVAEAVAASATKIAPAWTPVIGGKVEAHKVADDTWEDVTLTDGEATVVAGTYDKIRYVYDNEVIPQNKLPLLDAKMDSIALVPHARRIAIYYSQMAAFQAKLDYGEDLGEQLANQARSVLAYEIDSEAIQLLSDMAFGENGQTAINSVVQFNKTKSPFISTAEHYEGFAEAVENASQEIYNATQKFAANYMVIAANVKPVISFIRGWEPATVSKVSGPYFAGTLNGMKVFVSPALAPNRALVGVNDADMKASAAIYAPCMPIVPTQLLQYSDGGTTQGFSTLYDLKPLNAALVAGIELVAGASATPADVKVVNTEDAPVYTQEVDG